MDAGDAAAEIDAAIRGRRGLIVVVMTMIMMMIMVVMRVVVAMTVIIVMMIVIVRMIMVVTVIMTLIVAVVMTVMVGMAVRLAGSHAAVSASANRTHHSTSSSLIRSSSPAVTCNR